MIELALRSWSFSVRLLLNLVHTLPLRALQTLEILGIGQQLIAFYLVPRRHPGGQLDSMRLLMTPSRRRPVAPMLLAMRSLGYSSVGCLSQTSWIRLLLIKLMATVGGSQVPLRIEIDQVGLIC